MVTVQRLRLSGFDAPAFFAKLTPAEKSVAYFTSGPWKVIAWDPVQTFAGDDDRALKKAKKSLRRFRGRTDLPFVGGLIGWVSYDLGLRAQGVISRHPKTLSVPDVCLHQYRTALLSDGKRLFAVGDAAFRKQVRMIHARSLPNTALSSMTWRPGVTRSAYGRAFRRVMRGIRSGDFYQLNLTHPYRAVSENDPRALFVALLRWNPSPCAAYIEHGASAVISASPERFVLIEDGQITTYPVKGTRPRGSTPEEDRRSVSELLRSPKEQAELSMITDLLRNDIGKIAETGTVRVRGHRLLQKNPSVWHTYSVIEGTLKASVHPLDALLSMSPGGSVTGCPKSSALEEIDALEQSRRGLYCGSALMQSASGRLDASILIRTIVRDRHHLSLGVGGGIVADSSEQDEFAETEKKAARILSLPVRRTWIDGRETENDPRLSALDPAAKNGSGIFETMRAEHREIPLLAHHLRRLRGSARAVSIVVPVTEARLRRYVRDALRESAEAPLRVKLVATARHILIETRPLLADASPDRGIAVTLTRLTRALPSAKALPYHREWSAYQKALSAGYGETLLQKPDGTIPECSISNLFFVKRGTLVTASAGMLPGITRATVLALARRLGIPVRYATPTLRDLRTADEVFLTRSLAGIVPVLRVRHHRIGSGRTGRITRKLQKALSGTLRSA